MAKKNTTRQFVQLVITLVTTAFGLVAALAWNEAITALVKAYLPQGSGILSLFIYALIVTLLAVIVLLQLSNISERWSLEEKAAR